MNTFSKRAHQLCRLFDGGNHTLLMEHGGWLLMKMSDARSLDLQHIALHRLYWKHEHRNYAWWWYDHNARRWTRFQYETQAGTMPLPADTRSLFEAAIELTSP